MATGVPASSIQLGNCDDDPVEFLVNPTSSAEFFADTWEKVPRLFEATPERKQGLSSLFGLPELREAVQLRQPPESAGEEPSHGPPLMFGADINVARYVNGRRETLGGDDPASASLVDKFFKAGCTLQVHQPQRFDDSLWQLCASLEKQFSCLVGCNAYITPAEKQGLAPHYDDVEIFVLQTHGSKAWKLYAPTAGPCAGCALANQPSGDLDEANLGEPILEVTLKVGDVLYVPRGCIHQAKAVGKGLSSHLTISTYQRWSWADLTQHVVSVALADPAMQRCLPTALKAGLPRGFLNQAAFHIADTAAGDLGEGTEDPKAVLARQTAAVLRSMAAFLEEGSVGTQAIGAAADVMAEDVMRNRLPPHPSQVAPTGLPPGQNDTIVCRGAHLFRLVPMASGGGDECGGCSDSDCEVDHDHQEHDHGHAHPHPPTAGDAQPGPAFLRLVSCLNNDRATHMLAKQEDSDSSESESEGDEASEDSSGGEAESEDGSAAGEEDEEGDLVFPGSFGPALLQVLGQGAGPVKVCDLQLPAPELCIQVASALWAAGAVITVPGKKQPQAKRKAAAAGGIARKPGKKAKA